MSGLGCGAARVFHKHTMQGREGMRCPIDPLWTDFGAQTHNTQHLTFHVIPCIVGNKAPGSTQQHNTSNTGAAKHSSSWSSDTIFRKENTALHTHGRRRAHKTNSLKDFISETHCRPRHRPATSLTLYTHTRTHAHTHAHGAGYLRRPPRAPSCMVRAGIRAACKQSAPRRW